MRTVQFRRFLDDQNALRVRFELEQSRVQRFIVQLECYIDDSWSSVVRYDTVHNFAHRDLIYPSGEVAKSEMASQDYNEALTFAIQDLAENWGKYRERYERWLK